jgi:RHS repeat-associated protein
MHSGPPLTSIHTYTEYCGNNIFENGELKQTLFDGGYVTYADGEPEYHFYVRDHQGNNRLIIREDGLVEQVNDYTPFGALMKNQFTATSDQRYKYNGKELDRMLGLDLYDYGARFYDARIARWQTLDPLCEKYYSISPYVYCANNPLNLVDRDGRWVESAWDFFNVALDVTSFTDNVKKGNVKDAIIDAGATIIDVAAAALPVVPGGVGATLKASRSAESVSKVSKGEKVVKTVTQIPKATKNNYRKVLQQTTGKKGVGYQAHHTLPQKYREYFEKLGINIDEPGNVVWRESKSHQKKSAQATKEWDKVMKSPPKTKQEALEMRDQIEKKIWGNKGDNPQK